MVVFCRFGLVLQVSLRGCLTKLSLPALSSGQKMLLIICNTSWMNLSQEVNLILIYTAEIDHHKCLMLGLYSIGVIPHQQSLMVRSLPYILNGGMYHVYCNGTMQKGYFFPLSSLIGFYVNYRYCFCSYLFIYLFFKIKTELMCS